MRLHCSPCGHSGIRGLGTGSGYDGPCAGSATMRWVSSKAVYLLSLDVSGGDYKPG